MYLDVVEELVVDVLYKFSFDGGEAHDLTVVHPNEGSKRKWVAVGLVDEQTCTCASTRVASG
jgi:hypothetical protein